MKIDLIYIIAIVLVAFASAAGPDTGAAVAAPPAVLSIAPSTAAPAASKVPPGKPASKIDPAGMALLKKVQTTMVGLKSYSAQCWTTTSYEWDARGKKKTPTYEMSTLTAEKPAWMRYEQWDMVVSARGVWRRKKQHPAVASVCDGKTEWDVEGATYNVVKDIDEDDVSPAGIEPWSGFYSTRWSPYGETVFYKGQDGLREVRCDGQTLFGGVLCDKIFTHRTWRSDDETFDDRTTWYISQDGLVRRRVSRTQFGREPGRTSDATLRNIQINVPAFGNAAARTAYFTYHAPKGVTYKPLPKTNDVPKPEKPEPLPLAALATGVTAPDFAAIDPAGVTVKLSDLRGKIVVIDFWATWCPPCKKSMPHNQEVARKLKAAGIPFVLLAVDNSEKQDAFAAWVKAHPDLDEIRFVFIDRQTADVCRNDYLVTSIPTQFVIDPQGVIRASFVGYSGPTDQLEKAIRAAAGPAAPPSTVMK